MGTSKTIYFPGLNGLRAIAAIAVVISHTTLALNEFGLDASVFGLRNGKPVGLLMAGYGVSIFFVLSGFLITYLLQAEKEVGDINIRKFYFRRILRIWPLYYLYLLAAVLTIFYFKLHFSLSMLLLYIFYAANVPFILETHLPFLPHYWSLGVEEQFYLFWPWVNKKLGLRVEHLGAAIVLMVGAKLALRVLHPGSVWETVIQVTRFHCMMIGALGAVLYKAKNRVFLRLVDNRISQAVCWVILALVALNRFHVASVIDNEIISVVGLVVIIGQIQIKNRIVNLENGIFDFLGKISYGLYVIHPLIIFYLGKLHSSFNVLNNYASVYAAVMGATILLASLSYTYVEGYFLKLKKRYTIVKSSSSRDFSAKGKEVFGPAASAEN